MSHCNINIFVVYIFVYILYRSLIAGGRRVETWSKYIRPLPHKKKSQVILSCINTCWWDSVHSIGEFKFICMNTIHHRQYTTIMQMWSKFFHPISWKHFNYSVVVAIFKVRANHNIFMSSGSRLHLTERL